MTIPILKSGKSFAAPPEQAVEAAVGPGKCTITTVIVLWLIFAISQICANRHFLRVLGSHPEFPLSQPALSTSGGFLLCLLSCFLSTRFKPHLPFLQRTQEEQANRDHEKEEHEKLELADRKNEEEGTSGEEEEDDGVKSAPAGSKQTLEMVALARNTSSPPDNSTIVVEHPDSNSNEAPLEFALLNNEGQLDTAPYNLERVNSSGSAGSNATGAGAGNNNSSVSSANASPVAASSAVTADFGNEFQKTARDSQTMRDGLRRWSGVEVAVWRE